MKNVKGVLYEEKGKKRVGCLSKHMLKYTVGNVYSIKISGISCNSCRLKYIENQKYYWNCKHCSFDLCKGCYSKTVKDSIKSDDE